MSALDKLYGEMGRPEITWELSPEARQLLKLTALARSSPVPALTQDEREKLDDWIIRKDAAQN